VRVVSLLPAATEIVCALGLGDALVGRSHECDFPAEVVALPALTRARVAAALPSAALDAAVRQLLKERLPIYELDEAGLAALAPDVVVTQEACEVCAVSYEQVVTSLRRVKSGARVVSLQPTRLPQILDDVVRVADACGVGERGRALAAELRGRLQSVAADAPGGRRPRVAVIEWLEPPMLAGHWVPESVQAAGGDALGPEAGIPSPYTTWQELARLAPDAVIVAPCGFDLPRTLREAEAVLPELLRLTPRVLLMDGNAYLNRPGPRIVDAVETMAAWLRGAPVPKERAVPVEPPSLAPRP
jgi:iron complex transport system substrate-binding protein